MAVKFFGQYLVEQGVVSAEAIVAALALQEKTNLKFGEMAVAMGYVTPADIERAHQGQLSRDLKLGDLLVATGTLTEARLQEVVARQKQTHLFIGEALVRTGALSAKELERQLEAFRVDQAPYVVDGVVLPAGLAHARVWEMAVDLSYKLITRVLGLRFRTEPFKLVDTLAGSFMMAAMDFQGDAQARYLLSVSAGVQKQVARAIMHEETVEHEPAEVLEDSVMEFVNVVCGNVVAKASQEGIALTINPPVTIHPPTEGLPVPDGKLALCFPVHLEGGDVIELYLVLPK